MHTSYSFTFFQPQLIWISWFDYDIGLYKVYNSPGKMTAWGVPTQIPIFLQSIWCAKVTVTMKDIPLKDATVRASPGLKPVSL